MSKEVMAATISAIAVIAAAVITGTATNANKGGAPSPAPSSPRQDDPSMVDVTIYARLGEGQYSEAINVEINGKSEGDLTIESASRPEASMTVSLAPGTHNYEIQGTTTYALAQGNTSSQYSAQDDTSSQFPVYGEGTIDVLEDEEQSFELQGEFRDNTFVVDLIRR